MANWMTVPTWGKIPPVDQNHREQASNPPASEAPQNTHALVRVQLRLPSGTYDLCVSADDHYQLWLDGAYAGQGPARAYPSCPTYDTYRIHGGTTITLAFHIYYQGLINRVWNSGDGRFGVWVSVKRDGKEWDDYDAHWSCCLIDAYPSSGIAGYDTQYMEDFDSRKWPEGWEQPDYIPSDWLPMIPIQEPFPCPTPRRISALTEQEVLPLSVHPLPNGGVLLDFGKEIAGVLTATAEGAEGSRVTLRFGEELDDAHRVRCVLRCDCTYEEHWTLAKGISHLHQYDYRAFRYIEILPSPDVTLLRYAVRTRCYPMEDSLCTLRCPTAELEDIFRICKNAVRWCTQDGYLDCITREKGQYLGDAIVTAHSQVWLTGTTEMLRKCIRDFIASSAISPSLMAVAPGALMQEIVDYSLLFPLLPLTDYAFTGDSMFLQECYPAVRGITQSLSCFERDDGLLEQVSTLWNMVDWPETARDGYDFPLTRPVVAPGCHNVVNALWYGANRMQEKIEDILGIPTGVRRSEQIGRAYQATFYRPASRLFADSEQSSHCSIHANLYAAFFGLLPQEAEGVYEELLLTPGRFCGVWTMYFALCSLGRMGRYQTLYRLLTREDSHGWRNMLREGASACFEAWGKEQKWNTSLCHAWASGPIPLIIEELAGIRPDPSVPDGFRFSPHIPEEIPLFVLRVPWRGEILQITKQAGGQPVLERMKKDALSKVE